MKWRKTLSLSLAAAMALSLNTPAMAAGYNTYHAFNEAGGTVFTIASAGANVQAAESGKLSGAVSAIDKYGNISTDITLAALQGAGYEPGDILTVTVGGQSVDAPYGDTYSNVDMGKAIVVPDKNAPTADVAINMGNFAGTFNVKEGTAISFAMKQKAGYLDEYKIRGIESQRTNNRSDYASDEAFANFRPVVMGNIAPGVLYRASSPVNPELGRSTYADQLTKAAGIKTAINLADSDTVMKAYPGYAQTYYSTLNVVPLDMGMDFSAPAFNAKLKTGLEYMLSHEGPYLVHCNEGKDRTGFVSALLEALMGGSLDQIRADYMTSYENFFHVAKGPGNYDRIADSNILPELRMIAGAGEDADLSHTDLQQAAENYLTGTIGLSADQVSALKTLLGTPVSK